MHFADPILKKVMIKLIFIKFLVYSSCISVTHSLLVVNNKTISSDALSDLLREQIQENQDLLDLSKYDSEGYNSRKCISSLRELIDNFPDPRVIPFFDAWGKIPSGILYGNLYDIGNYDQCVTASLLPSKSYDSINGQHCFVSIPLKNSADQNVPTLDKDFHTKFTPTEFFEITIGVCVPDSCSPEFLTSLFKLSTQRAYDGELSGISVSNCKNGKTPNYSIVDMYAIMVFSIFGGLVLLSSTYDLLMSYLKKPPIPLLLAFSIFTNAKKLFAITTQSHPNSIECFSGMRVLSMILVVNIHTDYAYVTLPTTNVIERFTWLKSPWSMFLLSASVSVDTFFFMGGFLVAWIGFRQMDETKGRLNIAAMYVHRYIRLTPALAAVLLFSMSLEKLIPFGPFPQVNFSGCNSNTWWPVLLYIQNYTRDLCLAHAWYLAADFQLYVISPLLLVPLWKWGKRFVPVLVVLVILSIGWVMWIYLSEGFTDFRCLHNADDGIKTYFPTHARYSPWLIGFGLGYFIHKNRKQTFNLSKILQAAGWTVSLLTLLSIGFGPYFKISSQGTGTSFEVAMYESLKRASWAIALAWITFACHSGFGGVVNTFLSHPFWQPLARLTYSLYLVHYSVLNFNTRTVRTGTYFSNYNQMIQLVGALGISLVAAIPVALTFEIPVLVIEKALFGEKRKKIKNDPIPPSTSGTVVQFPNKDF